MNYQTLRSALSSGGGMVTITRDSLGTNVGTFLDAYYLSQPITITGAELTPDDGTSVVVTGRSSFLQIPDLPVRAAFTLDASGNVQVLLKYQLRDSAPGPAAWTFARSFPKLPAVTHHSDGIPVQDFSGNQISYLESLSLLDTYYVVTSSAQKDPDVGVALVPGINFVSHLRPQGMVGVLESVLKTAVPTVISGPILIPTPTTQTRPRARLERVWDRPDIPGIHLKSPLDLDFKLGKLRFDQAALRIYSPPSTDWLIANPGFRAVHGYTARLAIPSAGIEIDLAADLQWGLPQAYLLAQCQGITLGKLTELVDLVGSDDLLAALPSELQSAVNKLQKLELMSLGLDVGFFANSLQVNSVSVTIGLPSVTWKIWDDDLVITGLSCRFDIVSPFASTGASGSGTKGRLGVTVMGTLNIEGVPFAVHARSDRNFSVYAALQDGHTIPLGALLKRHAPGLPAPSDLTVDSMSVLVAPGDCYAMNLSLASRPKPWVIKVGRKSITMNGLMLNLTYPKGGPLGGAFSGGASFGRDLSLTMNWTIGRSLTLRGIFSQVTLKGLLSELCDQAVDLPAGFDLAIESGTVLVAQRGDTFVFQLVSAIDGFGTLAFEVRTGGPGGSGFAGGISLSAGATPSKVPGLEALAAVERFLHLQKFMLVFSSLTDPGFTFPDMAQFNAPKLATKQLSLPAGSSGVVAGINIFGEWVLDSADKQQNLLKSLLGLEGTLQVAIQIPRNPASGTRLFATRRGKLQGYPFVYSFGLLLENGKPSLFLTGSVTIEIQKQPRTFNLTTMFVPTGAFLSADMKSQTAIDCGPFKLSNLALEIGVNWAGIPSLGIAATIDVKNFSSSVALFFDSTNPANSLVAGSISNINAKEVMNAFLPGVRTPIDDVLKGIGIQGTSEFTIGGDMADELDNIELAKVSAAFAGAKVTIPSATGQLTIVPKIKGASWHLTDLTNMRHYQLEKKGDKIQVQIAAQFYFAPQQTSIGSIMFPQGFYLNAAISFAGFDAQAKIEISQSKGIAVAAQMDKIVLVNEKVFSIKALEGGGGPKIDLATFSQPQHSVAEFRLPHFYINGQLTFLGVTSGVYASVSTSGVEFALVGELVKGVHFDLDARFGKSGLIAAGNLKVGVGTIDLGLLGKAKINTSLDVSLDVDLEAATGGVSVPMNQTFGPDTTVASNDHVRLVFQGDGNLVLYNTTANPAVPLWASSSAGRGGKKLVFQGDGNLVIYRDDGGPIWNTATNDNGNKMVLRPSGNVTIHSGAGNLRWQTGTSVAGAPDEDMGIELETSLVFLGKNVNVPKFKVDITPDVFTKLPETIVTKVGEALKSVFSDANQWMNAVAKGVMEGVQDTEKVFRDVYKKSEQEAKQLARNLDQGLDAAGKAIEGAAKATGKTIENAAKDVAKGTENVAKDVAKGTENVAKDLGKGAKKTFKKAKFW